MYFVAASVPQARIAFESAAEFARRLDDPRIVFRHLELRWCEDPDEPTRFRRHMRVLGAEGPRLHGMTPTPMAARRAAGDHPAGHLPGAGQLAAQESDQQAARDLDRQQRTGHERRAAQARALGLHSVKHRGALIDREGPDLRALMWEVPPEAPLTIREVRKANPAPLAGRWRLATQGCPGTKGAARASRPYSPPARPSVRHGAEHTVAARVTKPEKRSRRPQHRRLSRSVRTRKPRGQPRGQFRTRLMATAKARSSSCSQTSRSRLSTFGGACAKPARVHARVLRRPRKRRTLTTSNYGSSCSGAGVLLKCHRA